MLPKGNMAVDSTARSFALCCGHRMWDKKAPDFPGGTKSSPERVIEPASRFTS